MPAALVVQRRRHEACGALRPLRVHRLGADRGGRGGVSGSGLRHPRGGRPQLRRADHSHRCRLDPHDGRGHDDPGGVREDPHVHRARHHARVPHRDHDLPAGLTRPSAPWPTNHMAAPTYAPAAPAASRLDRAPITPTTAAPAARPATFPAWNNAPTAANTRPRRASATLDRMSALMATRCAAFAAPPSTQPTATATSDTTEPASASATPISTVPPASVANSARSLDSRPASKPLSTPAAGQKAVTKPYAPGPAPMSSRM